MIQAAMMKGQNPPEAVPNPAAALAPGLQRAIQQANALAIQRNNALNGAQSP